MKIEVNCKELLEGLNIVGSIVNPKGTELVKRQVLICAENEEIKVFTFNDNAVLVGEVNGDVESDGECCVDIFYLMNLMSKFSGSVVIELKDNKIIHFKCGRSRYKTTVYPKDEVKSFVDTVKVKGEVVRIEIEPLRNALECVYSSTDKDDDNLSGAYIYHENGTDMITCSNAEIGATVSKAELVAFPEGVLPKFLIDFILKLKGTRFLDLKHDDKGYFSGKAGKYSFIYRAPQYNYPWSAIHEIIKDSEAYDSSFKFNNSDLMSALNRISVVADEKTHAVKLTVNKEHLVLEVEGPGHSGEETIILEKGVSSEFSILMDSVYLQGVLKDCAGTVTWRFMSEEEPQFVEDGYLTKFFMGLST